MRTKNSRACTFRAQGGSSKDREAVLSQAPALSRCWPKPAVVAFGREQRRAQLGKQLLPSRSHLGLDFSDPAVYQPPSGPRQALRTSPRLQILSGVPGPSPKPGWTPTQPASGQMPNAG